MIAKEKAKKLVDRMSQHLEEWGWQEIAKEQAKICVDEILWLIEDADPQALSYELIGYRDYWREVLTEIESL